MHRTTSDEPEVEVLRQVDLLPYVHQPLLLSWLVDLVARADGNDVYLFGVVDIVPTEQRDRTTSGDEDHVPPCGELDEACRVVSTH